MPDITAVLVAGYPDIDSAQADFEVLARRCQRAEGGDRRRDFGHA